MLSALVGALTSTLTVVANWATGRPAPRVKLAIEPSRVRAGFIPVDGPSRPSPPSYDAVIRIYNRGRLRFTVEDAGWVAADGELRQAHLPIERTIEPGAPALNGEVGVPELLEFTREHRGLTRYYILIAGDDNRREWKVDDDWRRKLREHDA